MAHLVHCPAWEYGGVRLQTSKDPDMGPPREGSHAKAERDVSLAWVRAQCPLTLPCGSRTFRKLSTSRPTLMA